MRVRGAIAILALAAALLVGWGDGSASTGAAQHAERFEEEGGGIEEEFFEVGGPGPRQVIEGEMVAGEEGWVSTAGGVFWTPDGGRTWRTITPPTPWIGNVYFADPQDGWALYGTGREGNTRAFVLRTIDGGRTWRRRRLRGYDRITPVARATFSLVGRHELFVLTKFEGDTASNFGPLFVSRDGGRDWRSLTPPSRSGKVFFETPRRGWVASPSPGPGLYRTGDGGRAWKRVLPPEPPSPPPGSPPREEVEYIGESRWTSYSTPVIGPDGHGILGMVEAPAAEHPKIKTRAVIWRTSDFGRTWRRSGRIEFPDTGSNYEASEVFNRRGSDSLLVHDPLGGAYTVVGPDSKAGPLQPAHGLPPDAVEFTFSDESHGLAYPTFGGKPSLSFTEDGGRDWTRVPLPPAAPPGR
jgi:photosystem II stability/assembly factor-like uncharacterized protein